MAHSIDSIDDTLLKRSQTHQLLPLLIINPLDNFSMLSNIFCQLDIAIEIGQFAKCFLLIISEITNLLALFVNLLTCLSDSEILYLLE